MTEEIPEHAENSPSSAEGWATCADYINANRGLPDHQSWEAAEGTAAHWVRNECLMNGEDAVNYIGHKQQIGEWTFTWTEDDAMLLQPGIDRLRSLPGKFYGEHRVDLTEWLGLDTKGRRQMGTLDAGIVNDELFVIDDEKWGRGIPVSPVDNKQLMLYALGFWHNIGRHVSTATEFLLSIDQPRHAGGGGQWHTTLEDLLRFGEWIKDRANATRAPNPPRTASANGCTWCRRKWAPGGCETHDAYILETLTVGLDDLDAGKIVLPGGLTPERRRVLLDHQPMIEKWLEQLREQALADALAGLPVGGMKAVEGRKAPDKWVDKEAAQILLPAIIGEQSFTKQLITPTQAGKKFSPDDLDWLLVAPLIERGKRPPILVSEEDARRAIVSAVDLEDLD